MCLHTPAHNNNTSFFFAASFLFQLIVSTGMRIHTFYASFEINRNCLPNVEKQRQQMTVFRDINIHAIKYEIRSTNEEESRGILP